MDPAIFSTLFPGSVSSFAAAVLVVGVSLYGCQGTQNDAGKEISGQEFPSVKVVGGHFEVTRADGRILSQDELAGKTLVLGNGAGPVNKLRIAAVKSDPDDPSGDIMLYDFMVPGEKPDQWRELCPAQPGGSNLGFPMAGSWTSNGRHLRSDTLFSLACLASAEAKCVHLGYVPWRKAADGTDLWDHHLACTRLIRADYCGSGTPHTNGQVAVDIYDKLGLQRPETRAGMNFEAAWGANGAACVRHVRIANGISLKDLKAECPSLPKAKLAEACTEDTDALLYSKSAGQ